MCAKCYRAIVTLIVLGKDPREYGFEIETMHGSVEKFYDNLLIFIKGNVFNQAVYFYWLEIVEEMNEKNNIPFIFSDEVLEMKKYHKLKELLNKLKIDKSNKEKDFKEKIGVLRTNYYNTLNKYLK